MNQCKVLNFQIIEEEPVNAELVFEGEIIQGSGGIKYETDPTVPSWAKGDNPIRILDHIPVDDVDEGRAGEVVIGMDKGGHSYFYRCSKPHENLCLWYPVSQHFQSILRFFDDESELEQSFGDFNQMAFLIEGESYRTFVAQIGTSQGYKWAEIPLADKSYVDNKVGDINSALDEIHAYAQGIISGGVTE